MLLDGKLANYSYIIPMIRPNKPKAEANISTTRIFIKLLGSWLSASTHEVPAIPTHTPQIMFERPTPKPVQNNTNDA